MKLSEEHVKPVTNQLRNKLDCQAYTQVSSQVSSQVSNRVGGSVYDQVWGEVRNQIWSQFHLLVDSAGNLRTIL